MNLPPLEEKARQRSDIKAVKTIAITIGVYFICYLPSIVYAVVGLQKENLAESWFGFMAWYSLYISSAVNPFIYYLRTSRFRSAFKQFLKDPFGSSDFKEEPSGRGQGEKRKIEEMASKRATKIADGGEKGGIEFGGDQPRQMYSGSQRNEMILSITNLQNDACLLEAGESREYSTARKQTQVQSPCEKKGEQTDKGGEEVFIIGGELGNGSRIREPSSSGKKVHPQQITILKINEDPAETKGEISVHGRQKKTESKLSLGKRKNAIRNLQVFQDLKVAWGEEKIEDRRGEVGGKFQEEEEEEEREGIKERNKGNRKGEVRGEVVGEVGGGSKEKERVGGRRGEDGGKEEAGKEDDGVEEGGRGEKTVPEGGYGGGEEDRRGEKVEGRDGVGRGEVSVREGRDGGGEGGGGVAEAKRDGGGGGRKKTGGGGASVEGKGDGGVEGGEGGGGEGGGEGEGGGVATERGGNGREGEENEGGGGEETGGIGGGKVAERERDREEGKEKDEVEKKKQPKEKNMEEEKEKMKQQKDGKVEEKSTQPPKKNMEEEKEKMKQQKEEEKNHEEDNETKQEKGKKQPKEKVDPVG